MLFKLNAKTFNKRYLQIALTSQVHSIIRIAPTQDEQVVEINSGGGGGGGREKNCIILF